MAKSQGLEGRLKTMPQVEGKHEHGDHIKNHVVYVGKSLFDRRIEILVIKVLSRVLDHGHVAGLHLKPELPHMDGQEDEDDDPQVGHIPGEKAVAHMSTDGVAPPLGRAIFAVEVETLYRVDQDGGIKQIGNGLDERIVRHEISVEIEGHAPVIAKKLEIPQEVHDEKKYEEQPGKAHDDLLADRGFK